MLHHIHHALKKRQTTFLVLLFLMFFFSAQVSLTIYIDSSFLADAIGKYSDAVGRPAENPEHVVGTLYTIASLLTILGLMLVPTLLQKIGNYRATLGAVIIHMLMLLGLGVTDSILFIIPMFIITTILTSVLYFNFDIFIERYTKDEDTGKVRGLFLMFGSIAWLLPPLLAGYIVEEKGFQLVYVVGALLILPVILLMMRYLNHFKDLAYDDISFLMTREEVLHNKNVSHALAINFFLHFFYAWMIIYTPLYLHDIGFGWDEIGLVLTLALSAFIIFPYPAGYIADKYLGEKELMVAGFILMAGTVALIPLLGIQTAPFWLWALVLFIGRTGASTVETMSETYFFKLIDGHNAQLIGYFRRTRPMAFVAAPIIASILLGSGFITIRELFYILAAVMVVALSFLYAMEDTK